MTVTAKRSYDTRKACAMVSGEEPLRTLHGTRPIDAHSISMEWVHGDDEPYLRVVGRPLFKRKVGSRGWSSDYITRSFRRSDYGSAGVDLPEWVKDFCARHDPNPRGPRVYRRGDAEPPADVVLLQLENPVEGCRFARRTPEGGWWFVDSPGQEPDPEGWRWVDVYPDANDRESTDPGVLTEVIRAQVDAPGQLG